MTDIVTTAADAARTIAALDPAGIASAYRRHRLDELDDTTLVDAAATVIGVPKATESDSFLLHAPLELIARARLLRHCSPAGRDRARMRIAWEAATFASSGGEPSSVSGPSDDLDVTSARALLAEATGRGELDDAERAGRWLGLSLDPAALAAAVGDLVAPSLAAAAHGAIFLYLLPTAGSPTAPTGALFGNLARELARQPEASLEWLDELPTDPGIDAGDLGAALAELDPIGAAPSNFIWPTMHHVEAAGLPQAVVGPRIGNDAGAVTRALLRTATDSMLLDDPSAAPYGWSHCLTMSQAAAGIAPRCADPRRTLAVAATYVIGFRATLGRRSLAALRERPPVDPAPRFSLELEPSVAAATVESASRQPRTDMVRAVVDFAAGHADAHLVKYVTACLDAAATDPDHAGRHLAAAAYLASWWAELPAEDFGG